MNEFQKKIYDIINDYGGSATRPTICMELYDDEERNRTTVYESLYSMLKDGVLVRYTIRTGVRGRPPVAWAIVKEV